MITFMEFLKKVKAASGFHKGLKDKDHKIGRDDRGGDRYKGFINAYKNPHLYVGPQHLSIDGSKKVSKGNTPVKVGKIVFSKSKLPSELSKGRKPV